MAERKVLKLFEGKLDQEKVSSLPTEIQLCTDDDTKLEFYEATRQTNTAYLTRARVIDNYYVRQAKAPDRAKKYSLALIKMAHGSISDKTAERWLSGYRNLGAMLNDAVTGDSLATALLNTGWNQSAVVQNPRLTNEDYCNALDRWEALTPLQKRNYGKFEPASLRELAGLGREAAAKSDPPGIEIDDEFDVKEHSELTVDQLDQLMKQLSAQINGARIRLMMVIHIKARKGAGNLEEMMDEAIYSQVSKGYASKMRAVTGLLSACDFYKPLMAIMASPNPPPGYLVIGVSTIFTSIRDKPAEITSLLEKLTAKHVQKKLFDSWTGVHKQQLGGFTTHQQAIEHLETFLTPAPRARRQPVGAATAATAVPEGGKNVHRKRPQDDQQQEEPAVGRRGTKRLRDEEESSEEEKMPAKRLRRSSPPPPRAQGEKKAAAPLMLSFSLPPPPLSRSSPPRRTPSPPLGLAPLPAPAPGGGMVKGGVFKQVTIHVPRATDTLHRCWSLAKQQSLEELSEQVRHMAKGMGIFPQDKRPGCDCGLCA